MSTPGLLCYALCCCRIVYTTQALDCQAKFSSGDKSAQNRLISERAQLKDSFSAGDAQLREISPQKEPTSAHDVCTPGLLLR